MRLKDHTGAEHDTVDVTQVALAEFAESSEVLKRDAHQTPWEDLLEKGLKGHLWVQAKVLGVEYLVPTVLGWWYERGCDN